jgi:hypothetical protein
LNRKEAWKPFAEEEDLYSLIRPKGFLASWGFKTKSQYLPPQRLPSIDEATHCPLEL